MSTANDTIVVKDRYGDDITHTGASAIRVKTLDGNTKDFIDCNLIPDPVGREVQLDFTDGDMEVNPDEGTVFSNVTIRQPADLISENIAEGTIIAGIKGSHKGGGGGSIETKPIRFYNAYGDVVYGFTRAEIQTLTELPVGPDLTDLKFDRWTHTLDELKSEMYFADVGPMYKKSGTPAVVIIIRTNVASQNVYIHFQKTSGFKPTFYWGDGTSTTFSGTATQSSQSHTYTNIGEYIISIPVTSGNYYKFSLGYYSTYYYSGVDLQSAGVRDDYLHTNRPNNVAVSVLDCSTNNDFNGYFIHNLHGNTRLRFVVINGKSTIGSSRTFQNCPSLKAIASNQPVSNASFLQAYNIGRLNTKSYSHVVTGCDSLKTVKLVTTGGSVTNDVNSKWELLLTSETPPTVDTTKAVFGTYPIYVPDSAVDAYKAASGWVNVAAYILPASTYPDK